MNAARLDTAAGVQGPRERTENDGTSMNRRPIHPLLLRGLRALRGEFLVIAAALAIVLLPAAGARAQSAPAGNDHPDSRIVSMTGDITNPFGKPDWTAPMSTEAKLALAASVDLEPLRDLAVLHNGRVKILDTLARETVRTITGRKDYQDLVPADGGRLKKVGHDPLFTFLDLVIDPGYYVERPLIHIEYLPLRRQFVEAAFPQDKAEQERWLKMTRLSPRIISQHGEALEAEHAFELPYRQAFNSVLAAMELYQFSGGNLLMIAPESKDQQWAHLSEVPAGTPLGDAVAKMGAAWRAGDAAGVNAAIATIAADLPRINPEVYPTARRELELTYNRANAFEWGYWAYCLAFVTLILAFGTGRRWLIGLGVLALVAAIGLHAFGFAARCVIAERFAIQNQFESMTGVSLFAALVGLGIMLVRRQWLFGAAAAGVGFMILLTATQTGIPGVQIEREAAILNTSVLLKYHVTTVLVSYGLIALGFIISLFYLGTYYAQRLRGATPALAAAGGPGDAEAIAAVALGGDDAAPPGPAKTLADLDTAQMTVLQLAFWTLGVGILLGAWWADHSWGRWWAFDPKETWALATWIIYLIVIHLRFTTGRNRALVTAWLSVLGFFVMLWTYFGVNLLLPGLHAYA